eukprot:6192190-Pleurochrysis_carterae.AAC.1
MSDRSLPTQLEASVGPLDPLHQLEMLAVLKINNQAENMSGFVFFLRETVDIFCCYYIFPTVLVFRYFLQLHSCNYMQQQPVLLGRSSAKTGLVTKLFLAPGPTWWSGLAQPGPSHFFRIHHSCGIQQPHLQGHSALVLRNFCGRGLAHTWSSLSSFSHLTVPGGTLSADKKEGYKPSAAHLDQGLGHAIREIASHISYLNTLCDQLANLDFGDKAQGRRLLLAGSVSRQSFVTASKVRCSLGRSVRSYLLTEVRRDERSRRQLQRELGYAPTLARQAASAHPTSGGLHLPRAPHRRGSLKGKPGL